MASLFPSHDPYGGICRKCTKISSREEREIQEELDLIYQELFPETEKPWWEFIDGDESLPENSIGKML